MPVDPWRGWHGNSPELVATNQAKTEKNKQYTYIIFFAGGPNSRQVKGKPHGNRRFGTDHSHNFVSMATLSWKFWLWTEVQRRSEVSLRVLHREHRAYQEAGCEEIYRGVEKNKKNASDRR